MVSPPQARYRPALAYLEEDRDAQIHERLREVDHALARVVDCHRADSEISLLRNERIRPLRVRLEH